MQALRSPKPLAAGTHRLGSLEDRRRGRAVPHLIVRVCKGRGRLRSQGKQDADARPVGVGHQRACQGTQMLMLTRCERRHAGPRTCGHVQACSLPKHRAACPSKRPPLRILRMPPNTHTHTHAHIPGSIRCAYHARSFLQEAVHAHAHTYTHLSHACKARGSPAMALRASGDRATTCSSCSADTTSSWQERSDSGCVLCSTPSSNSTTPSDSSSCGKVAPQSADACVQKGDGGVAFCTVI